MSENMAQLSKEYSDFIKEAYIEPIRTVIVVDDEFPSLDGLIRQEKNTYQAEEPDRDKKVAPLQWAYKDIERVSEILNVCREPDRHWLVDIHDAHSVTLEDEKTFAPHLHQSDLMILDYHLEGNDRDGTKAIEILRLLMGNDQFNLVIVYTQGYPQRGGDLSRVIREITLGLMSPDDKLCLPEIPSTKTLAALREWEDEEPDIVARLQAEVDEGAYLAIRTQKRTDFNQAKSLPEFQSTMTLLETKPATLVCNERAILRWLISEKQKELIKKKILNCKGQDVSYHQSDNGCNWIRTERLFITVVSKEIEPAQLPDKLIEALNEWRPHPHRLIMSKMRSELSIRGILAEEKILNNNFLETGWLLGLLEQEDPDDRLLKIKSTIKNHWDSLGVGTQVNVEKFASGLAAHLYKRKREELVKTFQLLDPNSKQNEITQHVNVFNCSKTIEGYHLTTGHVLETKGRGSKEHWLCLSPACDLVPGQKEDRGWKKRLGENVPFKAVRLFPAKAEDALKNATRNNHIFLNSENSILILSFTPTGEPISNPVWEQMFAKKCGKFSYPDLEVSVGRIVFDNEELTVKENQFRIVGQLRYEYALNLLQRLGGALSRVGLDFQNVDRNGQD